MSVLDTRESLLEMLEESKRHSGVGAKSLFAFDTETDGLSHDREMIGFSICFGDHAYYCPIRHEMGEDLFAIEPTNAPLKTALEVLGEIFQRDDIIVWIQNAKFDLKVLRNEGLDLSLFGCEIRDTQCVSWLLEPEREGGHGLKSLVKNILGVQMGEFSQFSQYGKNAYVPVGMMAKYAIDDVLYLLPLSEALYPKLTTAQKKVFLELEMPFLWIVEEMEHYGFKIDVEKISSAGEIMVEEANSIELEFKKRFGDSAQITSPQWLAKNLVGSLWGKDGLKKGKSGLYSTNAQNLKSWAEGDLNTSSTGVFWANKVSRHRKLTKMVSTYTKKLVLMCDQAHRVHGSFNQWGTASGRLSSSNPNMQNIPSSRSPEGDALRRSFIAEKGYKLIVADYSQIELRVVTHLSGDKTMTEIYENNGDIHQMTADACNCKRYNAKEINFGLIYKMGARTLGSRIGKTEEEAQDYIDRYFDKYSGILRYQAELISSARHKGFTWTLTGRTRPLPMLNSSKNGERGSAERKSINTQVQGSAADIIKIGMRNFHRRIRSEGYTEEQVRIIGQVHDEVVVEAQSDISEYLSQVLKHELENCVKLKVPLLAEPSIGDSWGEVK
jgi:DNA polymerase-1